MGNPRTRIRTIITVLLTFFVAVCSMPALAADPTDPRLMADVALAKATIALLQSRDFEAVRKQFGRYAGSLTDVAAGHMADAVTGEVKSIETISSKGRFDLGVGNSESQIVLEYQIGLRWVAADVVVTTENNIKRISGLYFSSNRQPLREQNAFHFSGRGIAEYAFLAVWFAIVGLTGFAMALAFRRNLGWRRWLLMLALPLGAGPAFVMNLNNGVFWIQGGVETRGAATFVPFLSGRFPMAWFGMFGGSDFGVPYLFVSTPPIVIAYLFWRLINSEKVV